MRFSEIADHLACRGFVFRKLWCSSRSGERRMLRSVLVFEMDNSPSIQTRDRRKIPWRPNLAEMKANDWVKISMFWKGDQDDFLPFRGVKNEI